MQSLSDYGSRGRDVCMGSRRHHRARYGGIQPHREVLKYQSVMVPYEFFELRAARPFAPGWLVLNEAICGLSNLGVNEPLSKRLYLVVLLAEPFERRDQLDYALKLVRRRLDYDDQVACVSS